MFPESSEIFNQAKLQSIILSSQKLKSQILKDRSPSKGGNTLY